MGRHPWSVGPATGAARRSLAVGQLAVAADVAVLAADDEVDGVSAGKGGYVGRDGIAVRGRAARSRQIAATGPTRDRPHRLPHASRPPSGASSSGSPTRSRRRSTSPGVREGMVLVSAMHITAGVWVNDDEPGIQADALEWLDKLAPPCWSEPANEVARAALARSRRLPPPPRRRGQRRRPPEEPARPPSGDRPGDRGQARPRPVAGDLLPRVRRPPPQAPGDQGAGRVGRYAQTKGG